MLRATGCLFAAMCMLLSVGCSRKQADSGPASPVDGRESALMAMGEHAEDLYDQVGSGDWTAAGGAIAALRRDAARTIPADGSVAAMQSTAALERLRRAVETRNADSARIESNRMTAVAARMMIPFNPSIPVDVTLLDYFGREIELRSAMDDEAGMRAAGDSMEVTWRRVKPVVVSHGGTAQAARFDSLMTRFRGEPSASSMGALAAPMLEQVDGLETVFVKP